jgi:membrane protease YdiL (CAAX protease family)
MSLTEKIGDSQPRTEEAGATPSLRPVVVRLFDQLHTQSGLDSRWRAEPAVTLLTAAFLLALLNFLSTAPVLRAALSVSNESAIRPEWTSAYWVGCRVLCYFLLPALTLLAMRHNPLDFGLRLRGVTHHAPLYVVLALLMLPVVVLASFTASFQSYYPFYDYAGQTRAGLALWELLYAVQFVTLEFFFRGFLLFSLERFLGAYAIFVMVIPYCMVHFGKPFIETLAAIPAGVILGALALRTRSIWPGAALHVAIAWTMDLLSLAHRGTLVQLIAGA